jgi:hypothetical protein
MEAYKILSLDELSIMKLKVEDDMLVATFSDGRIVSIPTVWFIRLRGATHAQLNNFEISPSGYGIHWSELDEDISIKAFLS